MSDFTQAQVLALGALKTHGVLAEQKGGFDVPGGRLVSLRTMKGLNVRGLVAIAGDRSASLSPKGQALMSGKS